MKLSSLLRASLLIVLYCQLPQTETHHIIFEGIGHMAGAVTYLHARLTINLTAITSQLNLYQEKLKVFQNNVAQPPSDQYGTHFYEPRLYDLRRLHFYQLLKVIEEHTALAKQVHARIDALRAMMPPIETEQSRIVDDQPYADPPLDRMMSDEAYSTTTTSSVFNDAYKVIKLGTKFLPRTSKLLPFLPLALGAVGTFMGLFSQAQISNLAKELKTTQENHNKLVEVVQNQEKAIQALESAFDIWISDMRAFQIHDPGLVNSWLNQARSLIYDQLELITHAIQQAQHRRLAVDFLSASQLIKLYQRLVTEAAGLNCQLLTNHPSDLFQLETSYFFDGENIHLLLHVPAVPQDSLLRLFRLHPFPLPLTTTHSMIPSVKNDILAISSGSNRFSSQFSSIDLMGCYTINSVYVCEQHGVLSKQLNDTCTGALYIQDFDAVQELCPLEITPAREVIRQLHKNWFLIFSPDPQTVYVECRNGTQSEIHLKAGISKNFLSPGCKAHFKSHLLLSDSSMQLPTDLLHFEWNWNPFNFLEILETEIKPLVQELSESGIHRPTINQIQQLKLQETKAHGLWYHIVHFVGNFCIFALILSLIVFGLYFLIKNKFLKNPIPAVNLLLDAGHAAPEAPVEHPANFGRYLNRPIAATYQPPIPGAPYPVLPNIEPTQTPQID